MTPTDYAVAEMAAYALLVFAAVTYLFRNRL
jgi:hypothetical protein